MLNDPQVTREVLCSRLNVGKTTIDNNIASLKHTKYIERIGSRKKRYWKVLK